MRNVIQTLGTTKIRQVKRRKKCSENKQSTGTECLAAAAKYKLRRPRLFFKNIKVNTHGSKLNVTIPAPNVGTLEDEQCLAKLES